MNRKTRSLAERDGLQTMIASLLCIVAGLFLGYLVLLIINPKGAWDAIVAILSNFFSFPGKLMMKYLGQTLVRTVPLLLCSLSVLFAYQVGMFNIGVAGQYTAGACIALYAALAWNAPWYVCLVLAIAVAAVWGSIGAFLKLYFNVNIVISGIMLNWISLYLTNWILTGVKNPNGPYTKSLQTVNPSALLPKMGLNTLFNNEKTVTIAIPLAIIIAIAVWVVLNKTVFGYELKATGYSMNAAKYAGMNEKRNIVMTMVIAGALAGTGAALLYLSGIEEWQTTASSVPAMGFNGIAVAFLGGLNPFGVILSSFFIQHITTGGGNIDLSVYSPQISDLIASLIIYLCAFTAFFKLMIRNRLRKKAAETAVETKEGGEKE